MTVPPLPGSMCLLSHPPLTIDHGFRPGRGPRNRRPPRPGTAHTTRRPHAPTRPGGRTNGPTAAGEPGAAAAHLGAPGGGTAAGACRRGPPEGCLPGVPGPPGMPYREASPRPCRSRGPDSLRAPGMPTAAETARTPRRPARLPRLVPRVRPVRPSRRPDPVSPPGSVPGSAGPAPRGRRRCDGPHGLPAGFTRRARHLVRRPERPELPQRSERSERSEPVWWERAG